MFGDGLIYVAPDTKPCLTCGSKKLASFKALRPLWWQLYDIMSANELGQLDNNLRYVVDTLGAVYSGSSMACLLFLYRGGTITVNNSLGM